MNCQPAFVILAAGKGTRMKSTLPKVMHKVVGLPMVGHVIQMAKNYVDTNQIIVVSRKDAAELNDYLVKQDINITWQEEQLGTAHAVKEALEQAEVNSEYLMIAYGDTPLITEETFEKLFDKATKYDLVICGFNYLAPNRYGRIKTEGEHALKIVEFKDATDEERKITLCNSGVMIGKTELIKNLIKQIDNQNKAEEYYLTDLVGVFNQRGYKVSFIQASQEEFLGANDRDELAELEAIFQTRLRKKIMQEGVTLLDPNSTYFSYDTKIGMDSIIYPNVFFEPKVVIGNNTIIYANCFIEESKVGNNCKVGPFAKLRGDTILANKSEIGSFVEVKGSIVGENSKAKHLAYIGDAELACDVNIGAGVIFCNYDGVNKHKVIIEQEVFIGSNSSLVAPINLKKGVYVAAGSVVTRDAGNDELVITRAEEKHIPEKGKKLREKAKIHQK